MSQSTEFKFAAETIAEIVNLKVLEVYRDDGNTLNEARRLDQHLTDLGKRIVDSIERETEVDDRPTRTGFCENCHKSIPIGEAVLCSNCEASELRTEPNTPEAPAAGGHDAATGKQDAGSESVGTGSPGTLEDGGEGTKKPPDKMSENSPAGDQPTCCDCGKPRSPSSGQRCRSCYQARAKERALKKASRKAERSPAEKVTERHPLADELQAWIDRNGLSATSVSKSSGVSQPTISALLRGKTQQPSEAVTKALRKCMESGQQPAKKPAEKPAEKLQTNGASKPAGAPRGALQFLQLHVSRYCKEKGYSNTGAAIDFGVQPGDLEALDNGRIPSHFVIGRIALRIPEVETNKRVLFEARNRQENSREKA